jgi:Flp pilus assembly protein TadG
VASESGQAAPLYIVMVAGLLFLAFAFFAVGQAAATRNGAQSAADAAALAAAQASRDDFGQNLFDDILDGDFLAEVFNGDFVGDAGDACAAAASFAGADKADVSDCAPLGDGRWGFTVGVTTQNTVGKSILPVTSRTRAKAAATAVVEPRCTFKSADGATPTAPPTPPTSSPPSSSPPSDGGGKKPEPVSPGELDCDGHSVVIDPKHLDELPDMADLFSVRLAKK